MMVGSFTGLGFRAVAALGLRAYGTLKRFYRGFIGVLVGQWKMSGSYYLRLGGLRASARASGFQGLRAWVYRV